MSYWAVARLEPRREQLALRCLGLAGYETYFPRLREHRISHGRRIEVRPPLFPGYCFLTVEAQWYAARWSIGVIGLIMDGVRPARVADHIIDDLRKRDWQNRRPLPRQPCESKPYRSYQHDLDAKAIRRIRRRARSRSARRSWGPTDSRDRAARIVEL